MWAVAVVKDRSFCIFFSATGAAAAYSDYISLLSDDSIDMQEVLQESLRLDTCMFLYLYMVFRSWTFKCMLSWLGSSDQWLHEWLSSFVAAHQQIVGYQCWTC